MKHRLCDTHVHVFDPSRFAYVPDRKFSPATANTDQLKAHLHHIAADRVVLVQPSVYGTDARCLCDALQTLGSMARGVAVVDKYTSSDEIEQLNQAGVVGARLNLVVNHQDSAAQALDMFQQVTSRIPPHWHIQLHVTLEMLMAITPQIERSHRHVVLDHLGLPHLMTEPSSTRWLNTLSLMKEGQLYVKVSAPYLSSHQHAEYTDLQPIVESLLNAAPHRVLWGSNWPHTQGTQRNPNTPLTHIEPFRHENDLRWRDHCQQWATLHWDAMANANAEHLYFC